jgi:hypothetical protein
VHGCKGAVCCTCSDGKGDTCVTEVEGTRGVLRSISMRRRSASRGFKRCLKQKQSQREVYEYDTVGTIMARNTIMPKT